MRIIGGAWRRRLLNFPDAPGLRPTPDRVRETLFNWLGQTLDGLTCLDLFAGSGALGFEAASRGAARVVMVESQPAVMRALRDNAHLLEAGSVQLVQADAEDWLRRCDQRFDVVFLDPPFRQGWIDRLLPQLLRCVAQDGLVYVECESRRASGGGWQVQRSARAGEVHYHLLKGESDA